MHALLNMDILKYYNAIEHEVHFVKTIIEYSNL